MDLNPFQPQAKDPNGHTYVHTTTPMTTWPEPDDDLKMIVLPIYILFIICFIGVIGNFIIVWVTFRGNVFRSTCYTFIALNAFSSIILELWNITYFNYVLTPHYYTVMDCWYIGIVPAYCMNASIMLTVVTSGDRIFSIMAPVLYCSLSKFRYLTLVIGVPVVTSAYWAFLSYFPMRNMATQPVLCVYQNYTHGYVATGRAVVFFAVSIGLLVGHARLWHLVKTKQSVSGTTRKIAKALTTNCVVLAIQFSSNLLFMGLYSTIPSEIRIALSLYLQCLLHLGFASNFFVYFFLCKTYRDEFKKFLPCFSDRPNEVGPMSNISQTKNSITGQKNTLPPKPSSASTPKPTVF